MALSSWITSKCWYLFGEKTFSVLYSASPPGDLLTRFAPTLESWLSYIVWSFNWVISWTAERANSRMAHHLACLGWLSCSGAQMASTCGARNMYGSGGGSSVAGNVLARLYRQSLDFHWTLHRYAELLTLYYLFSLIRSVLFVARSAATCEQPHTVPSTEQILITWEACRYTCIIC